MADNIVRIDGVASFVRAASSKQAWHKLGQIVDDNADLDTRLKAGLLDFDVLKVAAQYEFNGEMKTSNTWLNVCSDNGAVLGAFTERYKVHQPRDIVRMFDQLISMDPRFRWSCSGAIKGRSVIFNTAEFSEQIEVAGDPHRAYLASATSFDGTLATGNTASMVRTVCENTLTAARNSGHTLKLRHNTKLNEERMDKMHDELSKVIASMEQYKAMGDAMALYKQSSDDTALLLKAIFFGKDKVPTDEKDLKTQTRNQLEDLFDCYRMTIEEGTPVGTAWATLNAVTRYVDHNRTTRDHSGDGELMSRFASAQFGSGQAMKARAIDYLTEYMGRPELLVAA
jgi:phage/plasmid-like protein (TIGR03299 family)